MSSKVIQKSSTGALRSRDVIQTSVYAINDQMEEPELRKSAVSGPAPSVMPPGTSLNTPGEIWELIKVLVSEADDIIKADESLTYSERPVADYIEHTAMKTGSKLVIMIKAMATGGLKNDSIPSDFFNDSNKDLYFPYAGLQSVAEVNEEKFQLFEGFDSHRLLMFGSRPKIWTFNMLVVNGARPDSTPEQYIPKPGGVPTADSPRQWAEQNMDFADELYRRYETYYRGTKAVELNARCFVTYEDRILEGQLVMINVARNAQIPALASVTMTMVLSNDAFTRSNLSDGNDQNLAAFLANEQKRIADASSLRPSQIANARLSYEQRMAVYGNNQTETSAAQDEARRVNNELAAIAAAKADVASSLKDNATLQADAIIQSSNANAEGDDIARAKAEQNLRKLEEQEAALVSADQSLDEAAALARGDTNISGDADQTPRLEAATRRLEQAEAVQRGIEQNLKFSTDGDITKATAQNAEYVEVLQDLPDGTRQVIVYDVTGFGGIPGELGGEAEDLPAGVTVIETRDVTNTPEYDGVAPGTSYTKSRIFVQ